MGRGRDSRPIRVLVVDDDPDVAALTAAFLERSGRQIEARTAAGAEEGLARLESGAGFDCVVSDHDVSGPDETGFLEAVTERPVAVPAILFTGRRPGGIAGRIPAGVTDCLRKTGGTEQYDRLADLIVDAAGERRAERDTRDAGNHGPGRRRGRD